MGASSNPISPTTQKLEKGVAAKASATGAATFTFSTPPAGLSWTGTLNCSDAPTAAVFEANVAATSWGSWGGNSVFGPVQLLGQGSEQLVVTATGLTANQTYEVWLIGSSDQTNNVAPIWPEATSSALTAQISGAVTVTNTVPTTVTNTVGTTVSGQVVTNGQSSQIFASGGTTITAAGSIIYSAVSPGNFTSFVVVFGSTISPTTRYALNVSAANADTGQAVALKSSNAPVGYYAGTYGSAPLENNQFYFPISVAAGQTLTITARCTPNLTDSFQLIGYTNYPSVMVQPTPNTMLPVRDGGGLLGAVINPVGGMVSGTGYTLIAAAPAGFCHRLWRFGATVQFGSPTGSLQIADTVQIANMDYPLANPTATANGGSIDLGGALTYGPVTATFYGGAPIAGSYCRYDTIPIPSFGG